MGVKKLICFLPKWRKGWWWWWWCHGSVRLNVYCQIVFLFCISFCDFVFVCFLMLINLERRTTNGFFGVSLIETFPISCGQNNRILFTCIYTHCKWYNQSYYPLYCSVVFCTIQYSLLHMFRKTFSAGWLFIMLVSKVQCQLCKIPNLDTEVS